MLHLEHLEQAAVVFHEFERAGVPIAERRTRHLERLTDQRLRLIDLALGVQQNPQIDDTVQRVGFSITERCPPHLERLTDQRLRLIELPLAVQQLPQLVDAVERDGMPIAELCTARL